MPENLRIRSGYYKSRSSALDFTSQVNSDVKWVQLNADIINPIEMTGTENDELQNICPWTHC